MGVGLQNTPMSVEGPCCNREPRHLSQRELGLNPVPGFHGYTGFSKYLNLCTPPVLPSVTQGQSLPPSRVALRVNDRTAGAHILFVFLGSQWRISELGSSHPSLRDQNHTNEWK